MSDLPPWAYLVIILGVAAALGVWRFALTVRADRAEAERRDRDRR